MAKADIGAWEEAHLAAIRDDTANPELPMTDLAGTPIAFARGGAVLMRRSVNDLGMVLALTSVFAPPDRTQQSLWGASGKTAGSASSVFLPSSPRSSPTRGKGELPPPSTLCG